MAMFFSLPSNDTAFTVTTMAELENWIAAQDLAKHLHEVGAIHLQFGPNLNPEVALGVLKEAAISSLTRAVCAPLERST